VYDVSSRESFNSLANWLTDARTLASPAIVILLVGNKKDLEEEREVTFLEASRYQDERAVQCARRSVFFFGTVPYYFVSLLFQVVEL
jgi:GTPase SAR1 family protein